MKNQSKELLTQEQGTEQKEKGKISLPIIALLLDFAPIVLILFAQFMPEFALGFILLGIIFTPIAGIIWGGISLCQGKSRIGWAGVIISIIAIGLPIVFVGTMILLIKNGAVAIGM